jgi:hypothetical protein
VITIEKGGTPSIIFQEFYQQAIHLLDIRICILKLANVIRKHIVIMFCKFVKLAINDNGK